MYLSEIFLKVNALLKFFLYFIVPKCDNCSINALKHCPDVVEEIDSINGYDIVLDFSAYQPKWIHDAIDILKNKTIGVYIYISSDAVYEVSKPKSSDRLSIGLKI